MKIQAYQLRDVALFAGVYAQCASTAGSLALVGGRVDDGDFIARQTDELFDMCVQKGFEAVETLDRLIREGPGFGS